MNPLIERLTHEAGISRGATVDTDPPANYYYMLDFQVERFAALVAQHCAEVVMQAGPFHEAAGAIGRAFPMPKG